MKKVLTTLWVLTAFTCFCQVQVMVTNVIDADTYQILWEGKIYNARLENVDAPELKQHYGTIARDSVKKWIERRSVTVLFNGNDRYGRKLVDVTIKNQPLDSLLISKGFAWHYARYSNKQDLSICEAAAKAKCIGL